jgi:molecular chaperone HscB
LQLKGIIATDEKYNLPPDFLMEMMELNEDLDAETDIEAKVAAYEQELLQDIEPLLSTENSASLTENDFQKLKAYYYKKKYLKRILERLDD